MRKLLLSITFCLTLSLFLSINTVNASSNLDDYVDLTPYQDIISDINERYETDYYILSKNEFHTSSLCIIDKMTYNDYLKMIQGNDLNNFREELLADINQPVDLVINIKLNNNYRSTYGQKTLLFYNRHNQMTLKYKYTGSKFDTSYKPTAIVNKISQSNFFEMSSYTGTFKNSNKTYSVLAKGRVIISSGVVNNKEFTVNFNL